MKLTRTAAYAPPEAMEERPEPLRQRPARRLKWIVGLTATSIALTAGAIPAVAAATNTPTVYHACVTNATGAVKIVSATATCGTGQHKISWNSLGPAGPAGTQGPQGPQGATGPQGPQGSPGVTTGYSSFNSNFVQLPAGIFNTTFVGSLSLPSGTFLVNVTAIASGWLTTPDSVGCFLWDGAGGYPLDSGAASLVPDTSDSGLAEGNIAITMPTTNGGNMELGCTDQHGEASVGSVSITATPVSTLQASGLAARSTRSGHHALLLPRGGRAVPAARSRGVSSASNH